VIDFSKMKISELIELAEAQAKKEQENPVPTEIDSNASWTATLGMLRLLRDRGIPEALQE
jgi:hypothetical protein